MTKVAVITGGNRGLGFATARRLGQSDVHVIIGARDTAAGEEAADRLRRESVGAEALTIDVDSPASVHAAAEQVAQRHGRTDILINNAGILPELTATDADRPLDLRIFRRTFETNVHGAVSVTKEFLPLLRRSASGRIVNVSSTMGSLTDQTDPSSQYYDVIVPAYQMSKAALNGFTIALSKMLVDTSIKVNSVCPGWVQTDLGGPDNRAAAPTTPDEAAHIVAEMALIGDDGPTGHFVDRDGRVAW
jgi:NAD(P)-dependent dehydrogenase (short-subunit alcohol dehydrogenase family)